MANKITTVIDFVTDRATSGVRGFRQQVAEADGAVNKFKAGASSAMTTVQQNAGSLALAGGAALVAFGTKAVAAFQDTAIAAGKFSDATGLAVEDASRLAEVAGDVGVSAGSIEGAIVRMNSAAAKGDLADLGVEIQRTADGATDVNATFLETIRVLNGIKDPTERALAAQKIFGRGYKEVAEIIFDSADNVAQKLGEVSEAKVIDEDELRKAREFRESMDDLNDALQDIQLAAGEALVPLVGGLADVIVQARDAKFAIEDMIPGDFTLGQLVRGELGPVPLLINEIKDAFDDGSDSGNLYRAMIQGLLPEINEAGNVVRELGDDVAATDTEVNKAYPNWREYGFAVQEVNAAAEGAPGTLEELEAAIEQTGLAAEDAVSPFEALVNAVNGLKDAVDTAFGDFDKNQRQQDILADIADGWDEIAEAEEEAATGGEQERRDLERATRRQRDSVRDLLETIQGLPAQKKIDILAQIQSASLGELQTIVSNLSAGIVVPVSFTTQPGFSGVNGVFSPTQASADIRGVMAPQQSAVPSGPMITNIYPTGTTPTSAAQDLTTYYRRNGITRS